MKESYYQSKIKKHLESKGCFVSKYHATGYGMKGHPDLFASVPHDPYPVALYIEVKTPTGRLSPEQKLVRKALQDRGFLVVTAVYPEDIDDYLAELGICLEG